MSFQTVFSQEKILRKSKTNKELSLKVSVVDKKTQQIINNVTVEINGVAFFFNNIEGFYKVKAKIGDELKVTHPDFETVYYTINSNDDIKILVEGYEGNTKKESSSQGWWSNSISKDTYLQYLDSVEFYKKENIEKSISFIEKALKNSYSKNRNATSYKTLAEVYAYWKQYDLAIQNYKIALQNKEDESIKIALANAYFLAEKFLKSKETYEAINLKKISRYERILVYEGLGDVFVNLQEYKAAKKQYNKALTLARKRKITSKITDLNSKLGEVFNLEGNIPKANAKFKKSLDLAAKEDKKRSLEEQDKVADFLNTNRLFDEEIELRKESLKEIDSLDKNRIAIGVEFDNNLKSYGNTNDIETKKNKTIRKRDSIQYSNKLKSAGIRLKNKLPEENKINAQKINYKIGNAYILKEEYKKAIPYLEKSISDADDKEDLIVQKDATRKLSEVYASVGDYVNALKRYREYVDLVDQIYIEKEQEIQQAERFGRRIADKQNRIVSLEKDKQLSKQSNQRQKIIIYALISGIVLLCFLGYLLYRNNKQQRLANNLLALKSMRSQMNPHFIFNALNSVNSFIAVNDERNANRYLSEFSSLMRAVLENSDENFIPLSKEIELLELYVKLEHNRFKDKFEYTISIDEKIPLDQYAIPPMLLQPYIENAIWHGLRYKKEKGELAITMKEKDDASLFICIQDNGIGRKHSNALKTKNQLKQKSKGMSTIKNRIRILNDMYKDAVTVTVEDVFENGEGTKVELILKKKKG